GDGGPPALLLRAERVRQTRASASATDRHEVLSPKRRLPLRKVPGEHGPPLLGALKDRLEYLHGPASARTAFSCQLHAQNAEQMFRFSPQNVQPKLQYFACDCRAVRVWSELLKTELSDKIWNLSEHRIVDHATCMQHIYS
uniref:Uncharacterized protein n=1 Tax=Aegilops tauschii subsp. strangulata TaxID=200361 RepID=A0A453KL78_AEGTS